MRFFLNFFVVALIAFGMTMNVAEAKRFGGGKSFGSKPMFGYSQKRGAQPDSATQSVNKGQAMPGRRAMGGGFMGLLGGLAMGGLIGALFFGGAFENLNFLDILVFGLIAFLLFKLFAARKMPSSGRAQTDTGATMNPREYDSTMHRESDNTASDRGFDTDVLFRNKQQAGGGTSHFNKEKIVKPKGFDEAHFMEGAKSAYYRMQKAWDEKDLGDIRQFTSDAVFAEVQDQIRERDSDSRTEIVSLNASLQSVREFDDMLEASVLFDASLKEYESAQDYYLEPAPVSEVWHFVKPKRSVQPTWYLDGIQQLSD